MYKKTELNIHDYDDELYVEYDFSAAEVETGPTYDCGGTPGSDASVSVCVVRFSPTGADATSLLTSAAIAEIEEKCLEIALEEDDE